MTKYIEAFSWFGSIESFLEEVVVERPILHVCAGRSSFGDTTVDLYEPADVQADWTSLPFLSDSYESVFCDPPWNSGYKTQVAAFMREALRVAPVAYVMSPWLYGAAWAPLTRVWYRYFPGVNNPVLLARYQRASS